MIRLRGSRWRTSTALTKLGTFSDRLILSWPTKTLDNDSCSMEGRTVDIASRSVGVTLSLYCSCIARRGLGD